MIKSSKKVLVFLLITFGLMYVSHGLIYLLLNTTSIQGDGFPLNLLVIVGGGAPAFAALFVVYSLFHKKEQKAYWESVYLFKVPWFWWVVALASPLVIGIIVNVIYYGGWWYPDIAMADIIAFPLSLLVMIFAGGAEELGWRGILQNILSKKANLILTGLVIGVLWGVWHGPLFMIDVFAHYEYSFLAYLLSTVMYSLLLTLLVYKTKSVLLAILMHASINAFGNLGFGLPMEVRGDLLVLLLVLSVVFAGILYFVEQQDNQSTTELLFTSNDRRG